MGNYNMAAFGHEFGLRLHNLGRASSWQEGSLQG